MALKSPFSSKRLSITRVREKIRCFRKLPIFSPVALFLTIDKFSNFFASHAEKMCIFAPLFENSKKSEND